MATDRPHETDHLHPTARRLRDLVEPIAAAVYFAPEAQSRYEALGLNYFEGYFCSRSAGLGAAPWRAVSAAFAAFKPAIVERAVTGGWQKTSPEDLLQARLDGARDQIVRMAGDQATFPAAADLLLELSDGLDMSGRMLFAGLAVYAAASFACLTAGNFELLLAARGLQGAANAAPRVIAVAIVRDVYGGRRMAEGCPS